eukprot:2176928-Prorocentrum_lima.AAC.1
MTSSLVGSEMCIRDSTCSVHSRESECRWRHQFPERRYECVRLAHRSRSACLLYTSDAADDM